MISKLDQASTSNRELLGNNRLFAGLPTEVISEFGADVDLFLYESDDVIFHEGEPGDCLYLVCQGTVRISKAGRAGQQETLSFIQPGNFFGEMALIDGQPRSAQATASSDRTVLGRVDHATFDRILSRAPSSLHMNFLRSVVERLRSVNSTFIHELMRSERLSTVGSMANSIIHDLKNPMMVIRSASELIQQRSREPAIGNFVGLIHKSVDKMLDMAQELLDFARGESSLHLKPVLASSVLSEIDGELRGLIPASIHLVREDDCRAEVFVDSGRFGRVLLNLVKNAVEAMPQGGILWITLKDHGDRVLFRVMDTGTGIPEDMLPRIFEPFVTHGKSKGTGLGLAIAKSVVESHRGSISVQSKADVGTTFEILLPSAALAEVEPPPGYPRINPETPDADSRAGA
jgi:signal transduction histidine kinase